MAHHAQPDANTVRVGSYGAKLLLTSTPQAPMTAKVLASAILLGLVKLLTLFACTPALNLYHPFLGRCNAAHRTASHRGAPHHRPPVKELLAIPDLSIPATPS
jgi:hypothetical protein